MEALLIRYGPLAVFLGAAFEGDVSLVLAGVVAHLGFFPLPVGIGAGWLGSVASDAACYWMGRRHADWVVRTRLYEHVRPLVERLAARVGPREIVVARFVWGSRIASMIFWGVRRLPLARFLALDLLGCALSVIALQSLGFVLGASAVALLGKAKRVELWLLGALGVSAAVVLGLKTAVRRVQEEPAPEDGGAGR
ncbi:MAG TPA: DedA family protein [Candidatus Binatia bacterium]|nr:DedA family protein [Candidatus Binatia bacterium]